MRRFGLVYGIALGFFGKGMVDAEGVSSTLTLKYAILFRYHSTSIPTITSQTTYKSLTSLSIPNSEPHLLFSNNTLVPPSDFEVIIEADTEVPLFQEAVFRTAINVMYDVTGFPLSHPWMSRDWTTGAGGAPEGAGLGFHVEPTPYGGKEPSRLLTQYFLWGLNHLLLAMYLSKQFCQTVGFFPKVFSGFWPPFC